VLIAMAKDIFELTWKELRALCNKRNHSCPIAEFAIKQADDNE